LALEMIITLLATLWAAAALYFDGPFPAWRWLIALLYVFAILAALIFLRRRQRVLIVAFVGFALTTFWWLGIKPSNDRDWKPDGVYTAYAQVKGEQVLIRNVRNCEYRTEEDYTCHWETRSFNLANLRGADVFITWWGSPWIAHPIVSFDFGKEGHVAISIGTREMVGQNYSALRGFFRQYALAYTVSDERDVIRLRTNYRKDEEVYLFRTTADPPLARQIFLGWPHSKIRRTSTLRRKLPTINRTSPRSSGRDASASHKMVLKSEPSPTLRLIPLHRPSDLSRCCRPRHNLTSFRPTQHLRLT
jgi:hypothetical protein